MPIYTSYRIRSAESQLFVAGDEILADKLQFAQPSVTSVFDVDQAASAETRKNVFDFLARSAMPFTGMHLPAPGIGVLEPGNGDDQAYSFKPVGQFSTK